MLLGAHPALAEDPLLVRALHELLIREGVTSLIVATCVDRPDQPGLAPPPHDLRSLDVRQIHTWHVEFFGERRTAISTHPAQTLALHSEIYELRAYQRRGADNRIEPDGERVEIGRHFSQYEGLKSNTPRRVPLIVRLFTGYHGDQPEAAHASDYLITLQSYLDRMFPRVGGDRPLTLEGIDSYRKILGYVSLLDNTRLDETVVIQVDEFWAVGETPLLDLTDYMNAVTWRCPEDGGAGNTETMEDEREQSGQSLDDDPYGYFQPVSMPKKEEIAEERQLKRRQFFHSESVRGGDRISRVPYLEDFMFVLARRDVWRRHAHRVVEECTTIGQVWNALCVIDGEKIKDDFTIPGERRIGWREFFAACKLIGDLEGCPSFDIDMRTGETLSCFVLQVWASILFDLECEPAAEPDRRREKYNRMITLISGQLSLRDLVDTYFWPLYLALQYLFEAVPQWRMDGVFVASHSADRDAVASGHFYSTASVACQANRNLVPLGNPGSFCVRGDWYLCSADGSRSEYLAHRAIDILTNRYLTLLRLQDGLGLPARNVLRQDTWKPAPGSGSKESPPDGQLRTALFWLDEETQQRRPVDLETVRELGGGGRVKGAKVKGRDRFWLRRSEIKYYARHNPYWLRWLSRMYAERQDLFVWRSQTMEDAFENLRCWRVDPKLNTLFPYVNGNSVLKRDALVKIREELDNNMNTTPLKEKASNEEKTGSVAGERRPRKERVLEPLAKRKGLLLDALRQLD